MKPVKFICSAIIGLLLTACSTLNTSDPITPSTQTNDIARANLNLGIAYLKHGNYDKALDKLEKAQKADPNYSPTYNALGLLHQKIGENGQAEQYYKRAIKLNASDSRTLNNYGLFLCENNRYEEAQATLLKAANNPLYETPEKAITNLGTCALTNNHPDKAEMYFRQALSKNPKIPVALIQMSEISYEQGNYLTARGYFQRYLEIGQHTAKSLWLGIRIEQELGDKNALSSYALSLRNNFPDSQEAGLLKESGVK